MISSSCSWRMLKEVSGIKLVLPGEPPYIYMPTDAWILSQMDLKRMINTVVRKTSVGKLSGRIPERIKLLSKTDYKLYVIKSRTFITYKDDVLNLYRGNPLNDYSVDLIREIALRSTDWIVDNRYDDGRYLYYYDCKEDNYQFVFFLSGINVINFLHGDSKGKCPA